MPSEEEWDAREKELNERHEIKAELTEIKANVNDLSAAVLSHTANEKTDYLNIIEAINKSVEDRRLCEIGLRKTMQDDRDFNHKTFVKLSDLKKWGIVISLTVAAITFVGNQSSKHEHNASMAKVIEKFETIIEKSRK